MRAGSCAYMSKAMYVFDRSLFYPLHKTNSNEIGMDLFKERRAINPVGEINRHYFQYKPHANKDDKMWLMPEHTVEIEEKHPRMLSTKFQKSLSSLSPVCGRIMTA